MPINSNNKKQVTVFLWETDSNLNPTGQERELMAFGIRAAVKHLAYELGGSVSASGVSVIMSDGKKWFGSRVQSSKN